MSLNKQRQLLDNHLLRFKSHLVNLYLSHKLSRTETIRTISDFPLRERQSSGL